MNILYQIFEKFKLVEDALLVDGNQCHRQYNLQYIQY